MQSPIRIILADDHAVVRKGIRDFLEEEPDFEIVAEAADGRTAQELIAHALPTVAILDIRMPHLTGIDVTRWIRSEGLPVKVLILSAYDDAPFAVAVMQAGADGYVLKNAEAGQIVAAVRSVAAGRVVIDTGITQALVARLGDPSSGVAPEPLSDRAREVLVLAASGLTNRGIGVRLGISDRTVQGHLASIYGKMQVGSRTEAVTRALQLGWIQLPENPQ
ncbi:MAG: response regulator transcription factor [Anaerolineales bacterium]|nr:response regulator transcription factor [Anaerolineales bacterium]